MEVKISIPGTKNNLQSTARDRKRQIHFHATSGNKSLGSNPKLKKKNEEIPQKLKLRI